MEVNKRWHLLQVQVCKCVIEFADCLNWFLCSFTKSGMWTLFTQFSIRVCDAEVTGTIPELQVQLSAKQCHISSQWYCCPLIIQTKEKTWFCCRGFTKMCSGLGASPIWGPWMCHQLFPSLPLSYDSSCSQTQKWTTPVVEESLKLSFFSCLFKWLAAVSPTGRK